MSYALGILPRAQRELGALPSETYHRLRDAIFALADEPQTMAYLKTQQDNVQVKSTTRAVSAVSEKIREAKAKGYEGDSCMECNNFTLVRNGTCMKCDTCGSTSGCS